MIVLAAITVALSLTGVALAAAEQVHGEVPGVNPTLKIIVVPARGQDRSFTVGPQPAESLPSLKPGDKVIVHHTNAGGQFKAQAITKG